MHIFYFKLEYLTIWNYMIILHLNQCFYIPEVTKIKKMVLIINCNINQTEKIVKVY